MNGSVLRLLYVGASAAVVLSGCGSSSKVASTAASATVASSPPPTAATPAASAQPDSAQPDSAQPDSAQPDSAQPTTAQPTTAQPSPALTAGGGASTDAAITDRLCQAVTQAAPALTKLVQTNPHWADFVVSPGTDDPLLMKGGNGVVGCDGASESFGVDEDGCFNPTGVDFTVTDKVAADAVGLDLVSDSTVAQRTLANRFRVEVDFGSPVGDTTGPECAADAALGQKAIDDLLMYFQPGPIP